MICTREQYAETYIDRLGVTTDNWNWHSEEGLPKFPTDDCKHIRGHTTCSFENTSGTGDGLGFKLNWIEEPGVQGIRVGGDWEHPVQAFGFRWPENTIEGEPENDVGVYVPYDGNLFNPYTDQPLGNDRGRRNRDIDWLQDLGLLDEGEEPERFSAHHYDLTPFLDFDAMKTQFLKWYYDRKL